MRASCACSCAARNSAACCSIRRASSSLRCCCFFVRRLLRPRPAKDTAPGLLLDAIDVNDAEARIEFVSACRHYANELAVNEATMRAHSDLTNYLETGTKVLLDSLRHAGNADRSFRQSQVDAAIRFCRIVFGTAYAGLLAKAADWDEDSVSRALEELWTRHIIDGQGSGQYDYTHALLREMAYGELNPIRRRALHRRVARARGATVRAARANAARRTRPSASSLFRVRVPGRVFRDSGSRLQLVTM